MEKLCKIPDYEILPILIRGGRDWTYDRYKIHKLHAKGYTGAGVTIGVVDTGVNLDHPDFKRAKDQGRIIQKTTIGEDGVDRQGHGTWCCSRFIGTKFGFVPDCNLISYKCLNIEGWTHDMDTVFNAFHMAMDDKVNIISASIGWKCGMYNKEVSEISRRASSEGILIFCAAGNDGKSNDLDSPACEDGFISVGGFDQNGKRSIFSDYGEKIDLFAGGDGKGAYLFDAVRHLRGTSIAVPIAASCTAMIYHELKHEHGEINHEIIKKIVSCQ